MKSKEENIVIWLQTADEEYVAARTLLRQSFVVQGSILSASVIEKYLKVVCLIHDISFDKQGESGHNLIKLYDSLSEIYSEKPLNKSYLEFLNKIYKLRYPDKITEGFNAALHQGKSLVGLDETVFKIRSRIHISSSVQEVKFRFDHLFELKDDFLLNGNHTFGNANRADAFNQPLVWYEMRILKNGARLETHYLSKAKDDDEYCMKGLKLGSSNKEFHLQEAPIELKNNDAREEGRGDDVK